MMAFDTRPELTVSAVVVNHNGGENILTCVRALKDQRTKLSQIIVVDNASTDKSPERLVEGFPEIELVRLDHNAGLSSARNIGLQRVDAGLVLLLDDDIYVSGDALEKMISVFLKEKAAMVCPRILLYPEGQVVQCDGASTHFIGNLRLLNAYQPEAGLAFNPKAVGGSIGACMLLYLEAVHHIGGFNEEYFFYFEDLEFSLRLKAFGYSIFCQPEARVYHDKGIGTPGLSFRGTGEYPARRVFFTVRHRWLTILLIYQIRTILLLLPVFAIYEVGTLILAVRNGWLREWRRALGSIYSIRAKIREDRKFIQSKRVCGDQAILEGGDLQFAPGLINSKITQLLVRMCSQLFNLYWKAIFPLIKP